MFLNNLIFSLNATVPVFLMMIFGWFVHRVKLLDDNATSQVNRFVFRALLPALLFMDLSTADFRAVWDGKFVLFCMCVTFLSVGVAVLYSMISGKGHERGEIMIVGTVPLYNIIAVTTLAVTSPDTEKIKDKRSLVKSTVKSIVTNPIILGIVVGISWSLLKIPQPVILSKSVTYLGNMATPLSLISLGASFKFGDAKEKIPVTVGIAFIKLILFCGIFLPVAIKLGFRGEKLIAILVMLGSATTSSCFVMAKNFGHKGVITAFAVMLTTLCSAFTLTGWLFILKTLNYI